MHPSWRTADLATPLLAGLDHRLVRILELGPDGRQPGSRLYRLTWDGVSGLAGQYVGRPDTRQHLRTLDGACAARRRGPRRPGPPDRLSPIRRDDIDRSGDYHRVSGAHRGPLLEDGGYFDDGVFGYDFSEGYTSLESGAPKVRPSRESALKRWRRRRSELRRQRRIAREAAEEARMDEILEKLHREGRTALTDEENRFLVRVSTATATGPKRD